jgi:4a-hydroxytetrahydrobiopterin dehydratase
MAGMTLTAREVAEAGLTGWVHLRDALHTRLEADFATGLRLVAAIGAAAQEMDHHPDLDLRYGYVDVRTTSHDVGGVTDRDVRLARLVSEHAAERGIAAGPASDG